MDPNDMDLTKFMDEVQSLNLRLDCVTKKINFLEKKVNDSSGPETVRKCIESINIVIKFLAGLRRLSPQGLKKTLVEADAILNTMKHPIPTDRNLDETLDLDTTKDKLKMILKEVFSLINSLPNNSMASTSYANYNNKVSEEKILFWRKYKNKYRYIESLKPKLPPLEDPVEEVVSLQDNVNGIVQNNENSIAQNDENSIVQNDENSIAQNDENSIVQNDENSIAQNDENSIAQNDENSIAQNDENSIVQNDLNDNTQNDLIGETTYTINDIIQNEEVYEMFKSSLKNSPYDDPIYKKNVINSILTVKLQTGETIVRPVRQVAPLIMIKNCDDMLSPALLQKKKLMEEHFQSTSNYINDSNSNNTTAKMTKIKTRVNKTKDISNRMDEHFQSTSNYINDSNSNNTTAEITKIKTKANKSKDITNNFNNYVKTTTEKRRLTIKNSDYEPSKKKKKNKTIYTTN